MTVSNVRIPRAPAPGSRVRVRERRPWQGSQGRHHRQGPPDLAASPGVFTRPGRPRQAECCTRPRSCATVRTTNTTSRTTNPERLRRRQRRRLQDPGLLGQRPRQPGRLHRRPCAASSASSTTPAAGPSSCSRPRSAPGGSLPARGRCSTAGMLTPVRVRSRSTDRPRRVLRRLGRAIIRGPC